MDDRHQSGPTLGHLTLSALRRHRERIAFKWDGGRASYAHALELIGSLQAAFISKGLERGQRVALLSNNRYEAWCAGVAAQALGLTTSWLHPLGSLADHCAHIEDFEAHALVVDSLSFGDRGGQIFASQELAYGTLTLGKSGYGDDLLRLVERVGTHTARDLAQPNDIAQINYTGGTSGRPKGAVRRHPSCVSSNTAVLAAFEIPRTPIYLATAPISHVAGQFVLPTLLDGGTIHFMPRFEAEQVIRTIEREKINMTLLVPTMIYSLLDCPILDNTDLSSLDLLLYGASPMSPGRVLESLERIGPILSQLYGQTEGFPLTVLPKADHDASRPELVSSCGFPTASCDVKLTDDDGNPVPVGEPGEICLRAPFLMDGYWQRPDETRETLVDGWLHTSDIARFDEEGRLYIVDRKKDMIISGGFNIYPREVEDALASHPAVAVAAVIGVPDAHWGESVRAVVVLRSGEPISAEELIQHVKQRKGSTHAPKHIEFVDSLPTTSLGKIDKKVLREKHWSGQERMVS